MCEVVTKFEHSHTCTPIGVEHLCAICKPYQESWYQARSTEKYTKCYALVAYYTLGEIFFLNNNPTCNNVADSGFSGMATSFFCMFTKYIFEIFLLEMGA